MKKIFKKISLLPYCMTLKFAEKEVQILHSKSQFSPSEKRSQIPTFTFPLNRNIQPQENVDQNLGHSYPIPNHFHEIKQIILVHFSMKFIKKVESIHLNRAFKMHFKWTKSNTSLKIFQNISDVSKFQSLSFKLKFICFPFRISKYFLYFIFRYFIISDQIQ